MATLPRDATIEHMEGNGDNKHPHVLMDSDNQIGPPPADGVAFTKILLSFNCKPFKVFSRKGNIVFFGNDVVMYYDNGWKPTKYAFDNPRRLRVYPGFACVGVPSKDWISVCKAVRFGRIRKQSMAKQGKSIVPATAPPKAITNPNGSDRVDRQFTMVEDAECKYCGRRWCNISVNAFQQKQKRCGKGITCK